MISTRHAQANNPSFPATYDANLPRQDLLYLDANNIYGLAMSQFLPTQGFSKRRNLYTETRRPF